MIHPGTATRVRVYIIDGHALIRRGLSELLRGESDVEICGEAHDGPTAFHEIMRIGPDIVTLEISLNGNSGIELIKNIRRLDSKIGILVISMCDESIYAPRALRAGARGFVSKQDLDETVVPAIRTIQAGHLHFSVAVRTQMLSTFVRGESRRDSSLVSKLSDRELEVGHLIGAGATTSEIARRLHVSVKTIETHRAHLKEKLGLPNSTRLLHFWVSWLSSAEKEANAKGM